ncbi:MAG: MoaD/ThiS family protein [Candidatus Heimdallarchaeota archaeon]|nr:MoaD/ThiS family protein [Candidatus Heimdallarchaeota archaeon]MCK5048923.1 MoaD/ThiS family protein [Candidatus Heimdallarchaeota archaeon]
MVVVKIFSNYRPILKGSEFILEVSTVLEAIEELDKISGGVFKKEILEKDGETIISHNIVLVNGRKVNFLDGVHTKVTSEDRLSIFPPTGGG